MSTISAGTTTPTALSLSGDTTGALTFQVNGTTTAATITAAGNVGIGTATVSTNFRQEIVGAAGSNTGPASSGTTQNASAVMRIRPGGGFTATLDIGQGGGTGSWLQSTDTSNLATTYSLLLNPVGGNVGIGTSTASFRVTNNFDAPATWGNNANNFIEMWQNQGTNALGVAMGDDSLVSLTTNNGYSLLFATSGTERMRIDSSTGNVGIGTASPGAKLNVDGGAGNAKVKLSNTASGNTNTDGFDLDFTGANIYLTNRENGFMAFENNGAERMRIDSSGNVGIGTASPAAFGGTNVSIASPSSTTYGSLLVQSGTYVFEILALQSGAVMAMGARSNNHVGIVTNDTERMRITSGGNLLIGTTTNLGSNTKVSVAYGGGGSEYGIELKPNANNTVSLSFRNAAGSLVGSVSQDASNTAYNTSSDRRLKENIAPADDAGALVDAIQIVKHDWKVGGHTRYGVIAQDLYEIVPEAVAKGDEGDEIEKTWGVDYSKLVPILVKEIQSLRARVAELESK